MATQITVIGGGPGGYVAAIRAAQLGGEVTLIEREALGGTCLNWGCIPSKILRHAGELYDSLRQAAGFGVRVPDGAVFDPAAFQAHKEKVLATQREGIAALLKRAGVTLVRGEARCTGPNEVTVTTAAGAEKIQYEKLLIAAGTMPKALPGLPFDHERILSSNDLLGLTALPVSLVIAGGGVIGCEFACMLAALGVQITVVEALDRLLPLPSVDASVSALLLREMKKRKIKVCLDTVVGACEPTAGGLSLQLVPAGAGGKAETIEAEKLAVCVGRAPCTGGLGLDALGLETDARGWIPANERLETAVPGVYALGDILGPEKVMLAHAASHEGMIAAANALGGDEVMRYDAIPSAIFTMPEAACVGLSEAQAAEQGLEPVTATVLVRSMGKAQAIGELAGELKLIAAGADGRLLGVHITGARATELIGEAGLAVTQGLTLHDLADTVHAHPTLAELFPEAALKALGRGVHG